MIIISGSTYASIVRKGLNTTIDNARPLVVADGTWVTLKILRITT